jgi:glycosyltransferase involved in cell wall biosynthesis
MVQQHPFPPGVSIVICTYNGAERIEQTLSCLMAQHCPETVRWEVVLVDNGSIDNTSLIARSYWKSEAPLIIVAEPKKGITHARLKGIEASRFEFISFIDDDNWVNPSWVETIYRNFSENGAMDMCGGDNEAVYETAPPPWVAAVRGCFAIGRQGETTGDISSSGKLLWGAGLSFRKSRFITLVSAGFRFHTQGRTGSKLSAGEDSELNMAFLAAGFRLWYVDDLKLRHCIPVRRLTWEYVKEIFKGLGESEVLLDMYRLAIKRKNTGMAGFYFSVAGYALIYFGWRVATFWMDHRGSARYLSYLARRNYIIFALQNIANCHKMMTEISDFCRKAAEISKIARDADLQ